MSLEAVHVWQSETLRDGGGNAACVIRRRVFFLPPPRPSQLKKCAAAGQMSCRDARQAYRSVTNQAETLQQEHLSLFFSLLSLTRITRGDWGAKNTAQISLPPLPRLYLSDFFDSSPLTPNKSYMSIFCKAWNFLTNIFLFVCFLKQRWFLTSYLILSWLQISVYDPALGNPVSA